MDENQEETLLQKARETLAADNKVMQEESPLEKAERINKETKELLEKLGRDKNEYELARANDQMKGRSILTAPPKSQEEVDRETAETMARTLLGR